MFAVTSLTFQPPLYFREKKSSFVVEMSGEAAEEDGIPLPLNGFPETLSPFRLETSFPLF